MREKNKRRVSGKRSVLEKRYSPFSYFLLILPIPRSLAHYGTTYVFFVLRRVLFSF